MAKPLVVRFSGQEVPFQLEKVERADIYGYTEIESFSEAGEPCRLATLARDGQTLVGPGGSAMGYVSPDGLWVDKGTLQPVTVDGRSVQTVASSFSAPIELTERATIEQLLDHTVRSVYLLSVDTDWGGLRDELAQGAVFQFPFSYRGGLNPDTAFLLQGSDQNVFLLVGSSSRVEFVGLAQAAPAAEAEDETEEDDDGLDFSMF
ncbi:MAG: hypothetical protein K0Q72_5524 [Armatimonadetes bacterium]|nr:hypothetical protein [Armatimonadota bacterium]